MANTCLFLRVTEGISRLSCDMKERAVHCTSAWFCHCIKQLNETMWNHTVNASLWGLLLYKKVRSGDLNNQGQMRITVIASQFSVSPFSSILQPVVDLFLSMFCFLFFTCSYFYMPYGCFYPKVTYKKGTKQSVKDNI